MDLQLYNIILHTHIQFRFVFFSEILSTSKFFPTCPKYNLCSPCVRVQAALHLVFDYILRSALQSRDLKRCTHYTTECSEKINFWGGNILNINSLLSSPFISVRIVILMTRTKAKKILLKTTEMLVTASSTWEKTALINFYLLFSQQSQLSYDNDMYAVIKIKLGSG